LKGFFHVLVLHTSQYNQPWQKMANGTEVKYKKKNQSILTGYKLWSSCITCAASGLKVEKKTGLLLA
jgi:hypothetical protein